MRISIVKGKGEKTESECERCTESKKNSENWKDLTDREGERETETETDRQTDRQRARQKDRQTNRQTDRQTETQRETGSIEKSTTNLDLARDRQIRRKT